MILQKIEYTNFRNIEEQTLLFDPGVNLLVGENAQGKTNALEGIYLCAQGRSHRTTHERDYILYGADFAKVRLRYKDARRENELELRYLKNGRKSCRSNGLPLKKMSEFIGNFRAVIFCPEHLSIVKEGPGGRRAFLDAALCQTDQRYLSELQKYNAAMQQRNRLIAEYPVNPAAFSETQEFFALQMAKSAEYISAMRSEYLGRISDLVSEIFREMTEGRETPRFRYLRQQTEEEYKKQYLYEYAKELKAGSTLFGIHKDDVEITLNDRPARAFASQGQQKSIAVAMKLAEGMVSQQKTGEYPVFLLDDVLSELDVHRQKFILGGLAGKQVIVTCCDADAVKNFPSGRVIGVEKGRYQTVR